MAPLPQDKYAVVNSFSKPLYRKLILEAQKIMVTHWQEDHPSVIESHKALTKKIESSLMDIAAFFVLMLEDR